MSDPLSIVSGVVGLAGFAISTTSTIINLINTVRDAPDTLTALGDSLAVLRIALDRLADVDSRSSAISDTHKSPNDATKEAVKSCEKILRKIAKELNPLQEACDRGKAQVAWASVKTVIKSSSIKENIAQLESRKLNLVIAIAIDERYARTSSAEQKTTPGSPWSAWKGEAEPGKLSRRDSGLNQLFSRPKSQTKSQAHTQANDSPPPAYTPQANEADFSKLLSDSLWKVEAQVTAPRENNMVEEDESSKVLQMLWGADMTKVQETWKPNGDVLQRLKVYINERSCKAFLFKLKAEPRTRDEVVDALPLTFGWVWEHQAYREWTETNKQRTLLLSGKPGTGKSVLTKTIVEKLYSEQSVSRNDASRDATVLSYFCNNRERPEESTLNILSAFIVQYLWTDKSEFSRLTERCESMASWDPFKPEEFNLSFNMLWSVFSSLVDTSSKSHIYCIIDAMDECVQDDTTSEFIRRLVTHSRRRGGNGAALKLFISGRPDWQRESGILRHFSLTKSPLEIRLEPELTSSDIKHIVDAGFAEFEERLSIEKDEVAQLKQKLVTKANGMVLWAVLALREIKRKLSITLGWLRRVVDSLPSGVSEIYDRILRSLQQKYHGYGDDENEKEPLLGSTLDEDGCESDMILIWKAMLWVAQARRPLTLTELDIALSVHVGDTCFEDSKQRRIANIEDFVRRIALFEIVPPSDGEATEADSSMLWQAPSQTLTPAPTIRLIHQSAKDYILKAGMAPSAPKYGPPLKAVPMLDDGDITAVLITVLKFFDFQKGPFRGFPESNVIFVDAFKFHIESFGLLEYAATSWFYHMQRVSRPTDELVALVDSFTSGAHNNVRFWCQVCNFLFGGHTDFVDDYFGLHVVAAEGIDSMVQFYIARGDPLDERDQYGRTAYMMATGRGHHSTAKILEEAGADISLTPAVELFNLKETYLQMASLHRDSQAVADLLREGDLVDEVDQYGRTSLFYAGQAGDREILEMLVGAGADPFVKDNRGRHPLDVTLDTGCRALLMDKMAATSKARGQEVDNLSLVARSYVSPCTHHNFPAELMVCDRCGREIYGFYYHCCDCSPDPKSYDLCKLCWEDGKQCPGAGHKMLTRVNLEFLISWLEYSPHLANLKVEDPRLVVKNRGKPRKVKGPQASGGGFGRVWKTSWRATRLRVRRLLMRRSKLESGKTSK